MDDLIRRREAIDGLDGHWVERRNLNDWQEGWNAALEWVQGYYLKDLPSAKKTQLSSEDATLDTTSDCISRRVAIDALGKAMPKMSTPDGCGQFDHEIQIADEAFIDAAQIIHDLPSAQPEQQWIPCEERLPEEGKLVLCTHTGGLNPNRQVIEHIYQNGKFTMGWDMDMNPSSPTFGQRYMGKVIAWMPLPEPWKGEER